MLLTIKQSYRLLDLHGCFVREVCDRCGAILGPVRYTRERERGEWCSRECRDGAEAHAPGTCKHCHATLPPGKRKGSLFCDDACKQADHRSKTAAQTPETAKLSVTKPSIYAAFSLEKLPVGGTGHPGAFSPVPGQIQVEGSQQ
jgi:RNase P subunit RPR2